MAIERLQAGRMRNRLRFERRSAAINVGGVATGDWQTLIDSRRASVRATMGGEEVIAGRMSGKVSVTIRVRSDSQTRTIQASDRAVDWNTGETYNLGQPIDPFSDRRELLIQATRA